MAPAAADPGSEPAPTLADPAVGAERPTPAPVAYVMSRFPKLTETFILFEILAVESLGRPVALYPLLRHTEPVSHPEALALATRARYLPFLSRAILASQVRALRRRPRAYLGALATLVRGTLGSANFLIGGLAIFPKVVHMAERMEAEGVRHVHCHFANHPAAAGLIIQRLTGIPFSFVAHGSDLHVDRHMLDRKVREAAFVIAISEDNRKEIIDTCGDWARDRVQVVHCGVDTDRLRPDAGAGTEPAGTGRPFTILAVGTLHEVKGQRFLIDACRLLRERGVDLRCRFIGDGEDGAMLQARIDEAGLGDVVTLDGRRTRDELIGLLRSADVLVAPSVHARNGKREGIPVVLMEAMACGLPVVASRLSGIPELVDDGETGYLVPPGDAAGIADALARLAGDPALRARMGSAARARVVRDFDLHTNAGVVLALIDATAGRERAAPAGRLVGSGVGPVASRERS